jgi:hypothetical protein
LVVSYQWFERSLLRRGFFVWGISLTAFPSIPSDFKTDQEATAATIELAETSFSTTETAIDSLDNLAGTFNPFIDIVG